MGKVFSKDELQKIADLCVKNEIIILSDEVYDKLYYVPFTRIATLSPEVERLTLTVGSAGKNFYATGWRVGMRRSVTTYTLDTKMYNRERNYMLTIF